MLFTTLVTHDHSFIHAQPTAHLHLVMGNNRHTRTRCFSQSAHTPSRGRLILGNRAYLHGRPNPCLVGRVSTGVDLANQNLATTLLMSGGKDVEDGKNEASIMQILAVQQGFDGPVLLDEKSSTTHENLIYSSKILHANHVKSVIIVSEPYHLWRAQKLAEAGYLGHDFDVQYAAAPSQCGAVEYVI